MIWLSSCTGSNVSHLWCRRACAKKMRSKYESHWQDTTGRAGQTHFGLTEDFSEDLETRGRWLNHYSDFQTVLSRWRGNRAREGDRGSKTIYSFCNYSYQRGVVLLFFLPTPLSKADPLQQPRASSPLSQWKRANTHLYINSQRRDWLDYVWFVMSSKSHIHFKTFLAIPMPLHLFFASV